VTYHSGKKAKKGDKVKPDEALNCQKLEHYLSELKKGSALESVIVVRSESEFVVVDKPSGLASQPISLLDSKTITQWARFHYPAVSNEFPEAQPVLTPHRLDIGTSGILIVSLSRGSYLFWRDRFQSKKVKKEYLAWCWGEPEQDTFICEQTIAHAMGDNRKMVALKGNVRYRPPGFEALSEVQVLRKVKDKGLFLARVRCSTGVTHQVRVHLASLGFPLVGDELYDSSIEKRSIKRPFHALRATSILCEDWNCSVSEEDFMTEY
jgi:23S rRNA pseudouridine1911/1915/1917 synthase